jgi:type VI secretion system protein ImpE
MSETQESAGDLFRAGQLDDAVAAATAAVKKAPQDLGARILLAEMLLFAGNLERADVILDAAGQVDPSAAVIVAEFRQLLRAETARRQHRRDGRVPEFLGEPTEAQRLLLQARIAARAGDLAEAAQHAAAAEEVRPKLAGMHDNTAFDDLRDADDTLAGTWEVLTTTGKYYWVPAERVVEAIFHPAKRPRDLYWRRCTMSVAEGPDGDVYIPVIYAWEDPAISPALKLGRATDWKESPGLVTGLGQRTFLMGEEARGIMDLGSLTLNARG